MEYIDNWDKRKQRHLAFWEREIIDRCCISVTSPGKNMSYEEFFFSCMYGNAAKLPTDELRQNEWTDGELVLKRYINCFENAYLGGDIIPQVMVCLGASSHAGHYKGVRGEFSSSVWFSPAYTGDDPETEFQLELDKNSLFYKKEFELARYFVSESKGRFFICPPDHAGNMDALAHIRGSENLLFDLHENREWVGKALRQIQADWEESEESIFQIIKDTNEGGSTNWWLNTYAPGRHTQMQCDLACMISKEDYDTYAMPELRAKCNWMHRSLYHFDGAEQIRHLDSLLSIENLHAIQWTCVAGQPPPTEFIPVLRRIQAAGKCLIIYTKAEYFVPLLEQLSSKGLNLITTVRSEDEAKSLEKLVEQNTHE